MPLKSYRPLTKIQRYKQILDFSEITTNEPYKPLTVGKREKAGRNNRGIITMRRRGSGHKRLFRLVDFKRARPGVTAVVETIEYDPNRSANIALIRYIDGQRAYIIAPDGVRLSEQRAAPAVAHAAQAAETVTRALVGRTVADVERDLILETLKHCLGNRTHAANILGISIRTLRNKLNEYAADGAPIPPPNGGEAMRGAA